jgi:hypothetical protein
MVPLTFVSTEKEHVMKVLQPKVSGLVAALLIGAWVPAFAATPEESGAQQPAAQTPAQLIQEKIGEVCARHDKDQDGFISTSEWKDGLKKDDKAFKTADSNRDGRLDMKECNKGLGS